MNPRGPARPHLRHPVVVALHAERVRQQVSQGELARRAPGVNQDHLSRLEQGGSLNPGIGRLTHIAASLGKDICLADEEDYW